MNEKKVYYPENKFGVPTIDSKERFQKKQKKSRLEGLQERILRQQKDTFCNLLESKNEEIENLRKELEKIAEDFNEAEILNQKMKEATEPEAEDDGTDDNTLLSENSEQIDNVSNDKLKKIHGVIRDMKRALKELKNGTNLLNNLRKNQGSYDMFMGETKCDSENDKTVINRIASLKRQLKCVEDSESAELKEQLSNLKEKNTDLKQQLEDVEAFLSEYDKEAIHSTDRLRVKLVELELLRTEESLINVNYAVQEASKRLEDTKECLEKRQLLANNYTMKCGHVKELLKQQEESIPLMETQHKKVMKDLENEFTTIKSTITQELERLIPVINKLKDAQNRLHNSKTLLGIAGNKKKVMERELSGLKSQIEKLYEDIQSAKKNVPTQEQKKLLEKDIAQWENDTEVQFNQRVALKEKTQQLKWAMKKADTKARTKQKELCQLKIMETNLRKTLLQQYQHKVEALEKCEEVYSILDSTEEYLKKQTNLLQIEQERLDRKLSCFPIEK